MTLRRSWNLATMTTAMLAAILVCGMVASRYPSAVPGLVGVLVAVGMVTVVRDVVPLVVLVVAALIQLPLGNVGPFPQLQLVELIAPLLLVTWLSRTEARAKMASPTDGMTQAVPRPVRVLHVALIAYAIVLAVNFLRSKLLLNTPSNAGVNRTFYDYLVALLVYVLIYRALVTGRLAWRTFFRVLLVVALALSLIGLSAVVLGLPLNLGNLRYSVYDYTSGAVRIGFLETAGTIGLALMVVGRYRYRLPMAMLFGGALVASGGRGAAIGAAVGIIAYLLVSLRWLHLLTTAAVASIILVALPVLRTNAQSQRLFNVNGQALQTAGRSVIYSQSLSAFRQHPIVGTGVGVPAVVSAPSPDLANFYQQQAEAGGHATYASLLKNLGLAGFLPFAVALAVAIVGLGLRSSFRPEAAFFFIVLTAQLVSMTVGGNGSDPVYFLELAGGMAVFSSGQLTAGQRGRPALCRSPEARSIP